MKRLLILGSLFFAVIAAIAQEKPGYPQLNLGLGLGLDYGGIGGRLTVLPVDRLFVFAALGYNIEGAGYNVGTGFRISPNKKFCPYFLGMYGYNTLVIVLVDGIYEPEFTRSFNGPSIGFGFEQRGSGKNYFNLELLVPFRSQKFKAYKAFLEDRHDAKFYSLPVALSLGYHIGF